VVGKNINAAIDHDHTSSLAILDAAAEDENGEAIENLALDDAAEGTGTVGRRVSSSTEIILDLFGAFNEDVALVCVETFLDFGEAEVDDLGQFSLDGLVSGVHRMEIGLAYELIEIPSIQV